MLLSLFPESFRIFFSLSFTSKSSYNYITTNHLPNPNKLPTNFYSNLLVLLSASPSPCTPVHCNSWTAPSNCNHDSVRISSLLKRWSYPTRQKITASKPCPSVRLICRRPRQPQVPLTSESWSSMASCKSTSKETSSLSTLARTFPSDQTL